MKSLLLLAGMMYSAFSFSQMTPQQKLDSFSAKLVTAIRSHEAQRVYLATDKSVYINGESLWFKAFLINNISDKINSNSRFLFVDLVDDKDSVVKTLILDAAGKQTDSRIILPNSIASGPYWLRAYTRQMLQSDPDHICLKPLYVFNLTEESNLRQRAKIASNNTDTVAQVKFYPEGGNIITGATAAVAVHITNANGTPLQVKGLIRDNYDAVMAAFTTDEYGLAKFDFEPSGHRQYRAVINWNGKEKSYPLPDFNFYGGQVSVTKGSPDYMVRVLLGDSIYTKDALSYLLVISKDKMVFASIGRGLYQVAVPEKKLPDGIVTFYLFDAGFHPLSQRSIYVHDNSLQVKLTTDKQVYARHEKVTLNLLIQDNNQQPVASLVALSAIDSIFSDDTQKCPLYPADYTGKTIDNIFLSEDPCLTDNQRDLLMMIRGNDYETLSKPVESPANDDNDSLLYIKGVVFNEKKEPAADKIVNLISKSIFSTDTTDREGRFRFPLDKYDDSTRFALKVTNLKGRPDNGSAVFDPIVYPKVKTPAFLKEGTPVNTRKLRAYFNTYYTLDTDDKHVLPHVYLKDLDYDVSKRVSQTSTILTSKQINERSSVGDAVLMVGGLHRVNGFLLVNGITEMDKAPDQSSEPMILVNGAPVIASADMQETSPDLAFLNSFDPKSIDFIEIIKGADGARYGLRGGNGVILVNTTNIPKGTGGTASNLNSFYATGLARPALFPITSFTDDPKKTSSFTDNRLTLFWNGDYYTDKVANTLTFYTNDVPGIYQVKVSGITIHGDIINKTISFQTK